MLKCWIFFKGKNGHAEREYKRIRVLIQKEQYKNPRKKKMEGRKLSNYKIKRNFPKLKGVHFQI